MEILSRSLFALDRPWPPVIAALIPVLVNAVATPQSLGIGASVGVMCGFLALFAMAHISRRRWLEQG